MLSSGTLSSGEIIGSSVDLTRIGGFVIDSGYYSQVVAIAAGYYSQVVAIAAGDSRLVTLTCGGGVYIQAAGSFNMKVSVSPSYTPSFAAIAAGGDHSLALSYFGTVAAWGDYRFGQTAIPTGLSAVAGLAAGRRHSVAVKTDGTVVAWGDNASGQTSVPAGLSGVKAVAAGEWHTVALKTDGTVVAWGANDFGQTSVPAGLTDVTAIAAGGYHTVALKTDGTVVAWGSNDAGQTTVPAGLTDVKAISAGGYHTVALKTDGSVVAWGCNNAGQTSIYPARANVIAVAAGFQDTTLLWGDGGTTIFGNATVPAANANVVAIGAGVERLAPTNAVPSFDMGTWMDGQTSDLTIELPNKGALDIPGLTAQITGPNSDQFSIVTAPSPGPITKGSRSSVKVRFTPIDGGPRSATLSLASTDASLAPFLVTLTATAKLTPPHLVVESVGPLANESTILFGSATPGAPVQFTQTLTLRNTGGSPLERISLGMDRYPLVFLVSPLAKTTLAAGESQTLTLRFSPRINGIYSDRLGIASNDPIRRVFSLTLLGQGGPGVTEGSQGINLGAVDSGDSVERSFTFVNTTNHTVTGLRLLLTGADAARMTISPALPDTLAAGQSITFTARFTGLGSGDRTVTLSLLTDASSDPAAAFSLTTTVRAPKLVVRYQGKPVDPASHEKVVAEWDYWSPTTLIPVPDGLTGIVAVTKGWSHSVGLKEDGTVVTWGDTFGGQLDAPAGLSGVVAIGAGFVYTVALKEDGKVVGWGDNAAARVPTGLSGVAAIAAGPYHVVALKRDGTVVAWGQGLAGETRVPKGLSGVTAVAAGSGHSLALKQDGTVVAWGTKSYGLSSVPPGLSEVEAIAAADFDSVALKRDGTIVAWGANFGYGWNGNLDASSGWSVDLGGITAISGCRPILLLKRDGTLINRSQLKSAWEPVPVTFSGVTAISAGMNRAIVLADPAGDFGQVRSFQQSPPERLHGFTISNGGQYPLSFAASIEGPDADQFSLAGPTLTLAPNANSLLSVRFVPTRLGAMRATLKLTSNDPETPSYTLDLTGAETFVSKAAAKSGVAGSNPAYDPPVRDRATGLVVQRVSFANPTGEPLNGMRLVISHLTPGVTVQSSSATDKFGTVEVIYPKPIAKDETISLTLTYHDPLRRATLQPVIHAESLMETPPREGPVAGVLVPQPSVRDTPNGPLLEWNAVARKTYVVEYSDDAGTTWYSAVHRLVAGGSKYRWIDQGQPETWTKPANKAARVYRVRMLDK